MTAIANKNSRVALSMAVFAAAMLGLAFASVPLYRMFCQLTGFDGTPLRAEKAPGAVAGEIGVRFDANVAPNLAWRFEPEQETVRIQPGAEQQGGVVAQQPLQHLQRRAGVGPGFAEADRDRI